MSQCHSLSKPSQPFQAALAVACFLSMAGIASAASKPAREKAAAGKEGKAGKEREESDRAARERTARKACLAGDYAKGVDILAELFVDTRDPNYLFNQGRCFEQNRRYQDAIARFQEYLVASGPKLSPEDTLVAEQRVKACKEMLSQERAESGVAVAPQPVLPAPTPEPLAPAATLTQTAPPPPRSDGAGLRIGGVVVASVGVAAVGAGVLLNLKANSMVDDMYATNNGYTKESQRKNYETIAWIGYGVGAACIATGAVLYTLGLRAKSRANNLALVPAVGAGGLGATLMGGF